MKKIYVTYIRPYFDYCDIVYDGHLTTYDERRLETVQNRAARLITGALYRTSTDKLRLELGWDRLSTRREIHRLTFFRLLIDRDIPIPSYIRDSLPQIRQSDTSRTLRNSTAMTLPDNRTTRYQKSFIPDTTRKWNKLPQSIRSQPSRKQFKSQISNLIGIEQPPEYFNFGTKLGNTLHTQLRVGMSKLNSHLFQIQKTTHPHCPCGHRTESTHHFILHCPLYTEHRQALMQNISAKLGVDFTQFTQTKQLETLLYGLHIGAASGRGVAGLFQNFLLKTNRLTSSPPRT